MAVPLIKNNKLELSLLLSLLQADTDVASNPNIDWTLFYKLVIRHRVWHLVHKALLETAPPILPVLTKRCQQDIFHLLNTANETVRIAAKFNEQAVEHCFIKGILLNLHLYGGLGTRPCRDIDVWIKLSDYPRAIDALLSLGYKKKLPNYELSGFKQSYYMQHRHDMAFYHPDKRILIEPHFRLDYFGINFFPWESLTQKSIRVFNQDIMTLDDDYHLLYLMIHGSIHAWIRLRWLQDIALFIQSNKCDLNHVVDLAKQIKCEHLFEQTLLLVNDLFPSNNKVISSFIHKPSRKSLQLAALSKQFIEGDYEMTDGFRHYKMFFKYRFYLAKLAVKGQKLQTILGDLLKIDEVFQYVTFPDKLAFMYYLIYPIWVIKYAWQSIRR